MLLKLMSKSVLPMYSSRSFMISGLTFKTLTYFKYIKTIYFSCVYIFFFCRGEEILKIFDRCFAINTRKVLGVGGEGGRSILFN